MKSTKRRRVDVNLEELDRVLDGARQAPLSEADCDKLKSALHALAAMLERPRNTEKPAPCWIKRRTRRPAMALNRIPTFPRNPDTGATQRRLLAGRGRSTLRTRS